MSKRAPPATPPAVLTNTAERPSSSGEGKRTRSEPDSCKRPRRVTPPSQRTSKRTAPCARLAAKIAEAARVSVRIHPSGGGRARAASEYYFCFEHDLVGKPAPTFPDHALQSHLAADLVRVEIFAVAPVFHRAPVHDREIVAELAGKVEILFDQHDGDVAEIAQIGNGAADVLDNRGLDAFGRFIEQEKLRPHHQRAANGKLLLLAAGEVAAPAAKHA